MTRPGRSRVEHRTHRLIASRYPTVGVFDDLTSDPEELRVAFLLANATNDRLSLLGKRIGAIPDSEIVTGPTASLVMAAFLHADPAGGRFTDSRLGAWYASFEIETAIEEVCFHSERRLRHSAQGFPSSIQMRELIADIDCALYDIRGQQGEHPELYDPDVTSYGAAQRFGVALRWPSDESEPERGIVYDSVRRASGTNVCLYRPSVIPLPVIQGDHYQMHWDSGGDRRIAKLTNVEL